MSTVLERRGSEHGALPAPARHRFSAEDFQRLGELGFFAEDDRVELINGEILDMAPIGSNHAGLVTQLTQWLVSRLGNAALVSPQNPVRLADDVEVYPDRVLLKPDRTFYRERIPTAGDVLLVIEVAQSSLRYDREIKVPLYAEHRIPEVWLFDLRDDKMERYREPSRDGYGRVDRPAKGASLVLEGIPGTAFQLTW